MLSIRLELHPLDPTFGHWCAGCALPSGVGLVVLIADARTLRVVSRVEVARCQDCGAPCEVER